VLLRQVVYSPGDIVCREGDIGTEMYIVKLGELDVVSSREQMIYATLGEGNYFGEVSHSMQIKQNLCLHSSDH